MRKNKGRKHFQEDIPSHPVSRNEAREPTFPNYRPREMRFHDWPGPNHDSSFGVDTFMLQETNWGLGKDTSPGTKSFLPTA